MNLNSNFIAERRRFILQTLTVDEENNFVPPSTTGTLFDTTRLQWHNMNGYKCIWDRRLFEFDLSNIIFYVTQMLYVTMERDNNLYERGRNGII